MKVVFDTNVYVAEALMGPRARRVIVACQQARWRIYVSEFLLDELERVLRERLGFLRLAKLARRRAKRRAKEVVPAESRHHVPDDPNDSPILRTALAAGADYLVSNDRHLLTLQPYEGLDIISLGAFEQLLRAQGFLR